MINLDVAEHEKTPDWYLEVGRYYSTFYNKPIFPFLNNETALTPVDEMNRCFLYYYGQQGAARNFPVIQDTILMELQSRNNQIFQLVNSLHGKMSEFMAKFNISTELLSPDAKSRRDLVKRILIFQIENKDFYMTMKNLGVMLTAVPEDVILNTREDVEEYMEVGYREEGAEHAENLSKALIKINDYATLKTQEFVNVCVAGLTSSDRYIENGILKEEALSPQSVILDFRNKTDNAYNDSAWFRGHWQNLVSKDGILDKYGDRLNPQDLAEIKKLTSPQQSTNYYATFTQLYPASPTTYYNWWQGNGSYLTSLSVAKIYFKARVDYRYKMKDGRVMKHLDLNAKGEPIIENQNRKGIVGNYRWHQVVIIGNKWVCDYGLVPNAVYEHLNLGQQECPQTVFIDNYIGGYYRSRVSRMTDLQDDYNLATIKRKAAMVNDLGVNYIITEAGDDSNKTIQDIFKDFNSQHMTMLKKDLDNPDLIPMKFAEAVDFTKSLNVVPIYEGIMKSVESEMSKMMHLPDVSQGLQQSTIGKGVQQATTYLAAVGVAPLFNGFVNYIQKGIQLSANIQKLAFCADDANEEYARTILGDRGYEWIKSATTESFEMLGIYINPYDQIDQEKRMALDAKIQAGVQAGVIDFMDALKMETMTSYRHAVAYIERVSKQRKLENQKLAEQARMDNLAIADANMQNRLKEKQIPADAVVAGKQITSQTERENNAATNQTKKEIEDMRAQLKLIIDRLNKSN